MRPKRTVFPLHKPFERQPAASETAEIVFRLVVDFYSDSPVMIGTATTICGNLLITARHVLETIAGPFQDGAARELHRGLTAIQILPGPEYALWEVLTCWLCPQTDIAFLHLAGRPAGSKPEAPIVWKQPTVSPFPPSVGDAVAGFGYRLSRITVSKNAKGGNHYDLQDESMATVGLVREIFQVRRDSSHLNFPCYQVSARFDAGMSGGPVFDETGALCGIICSNVEGSHLDGEPISYVATLWPMFLQLISAGRGPSYARGVMYPVIELARTGMIHVDDLPALEKLMPEGKEREK